MCVSLPAKNFWENLTEEERASWRMLQYDPTLPLYPEWMTREVETPQMPDPTGKSPIDWSSITRDCS